MSAIITVRVDKRTKDKIAKLKINASKTAREALHEEIRKREEAKMKVALKEAGQVLRKIPEKDIVRAVRQSRSER